MIQYYPRIDHLVIHCSATPATHNWTSKDIDLCHRRRGWSGCGYHFVICRDGTIESDSLGHSCRPLSQSGAHIGGVGSGWNQRSIGICLIGGVDKEMKEENNFTDLQFDSLKTLLNDLRDVYPNSRICGHRDLLKEYKRPMKACPSFEVVDFLKESDILANTL